MNAVRGRRRRRRFVAALTAVVLVLSASAGGVMLWERAHGLGPGAFAGVVAGRLESMLRPAGETGTDDGTTSEDGVVSDSGMETRYPSVKSSVDFDGDGVGAVNPPVAWGGSRPARRR